MNLIISFIRSYSVGLTEFLRQLMYLGLAFGLLQWTDEQQGIVLSALSAMFALFVSKQTIASNKVDDIVDKGMERAAKLDMDSGGKNGPN